MLKYTNAELIERIQRDIESFGSDMTVERFYCLYNQMKRIKKMDKMKKMDKVKKRILKDYENYIYQQYKWLMDDDEAESTIDNYEFHVGEMHGEIYDSKFWENYFKKKKRKQKNQEEIDKFKRIAVELFEDCDTYKEVLNVIEKHTQA